MEAEVTVTVKALRACIGVAVSRGVCIEAVLEPLGVDPTQLEDPDAHVPLACIGRAWALAEQLTGDPALGLHAAELAVGRPAHVVDYLVAHARRPREAFSLVERYQRLFSNGGTLGLEISGRAATFSYRPQKRLTRPPQMADFVVGQWALLLRPRCPGGFPLRQVRLEHAAPADTREHERLFGVPVVFDAPFDAIEFDAALLDVELSNADPLIVGLLRRYAEEALARMPGLPRTTERLRRHLMQMSMVEPPTVERTARILGLSERSLQRQLHAEGTSFREVFDLVRRDLALSHLRDRRHSVSEIACLLGFAEPSAFTRAFRRWTRTSPLEWRVRALAAADKS